MSAIKKAVVVVLLFWIAAAFSHSLSNKMGIGLVEPDFLLILAVVLSTLHDPRSGAFFGFVAGAIDGAIVGADMTAMTVTRTVAGFLSGYIGNLDFEVRPVYTALVAAGATILCHVLFAFSAPPPHVGVYARDTIFSALYNGVLAMPLYAAVQRPLRRQEK